MEIIINNNKKTEDLKSEIRKEGFDKIHILADFYRTLTYGSVDGKKTPSIISMLRDGNHLLSDYSEKAHKLFDKYHKIEIDPNIDIEEKKKAMKTWWQEHNELLIKSGLNKKDLVDIVENGHIRFRDGVEEFLDFLYKKNIPLIIFSASGCGDAIQLFFHKYKKDYSNIFYVTNKFYWDKKDNAISYQDLIIHSLNKDETILKEIPEVFEKIENRKNVILMGDSMGDLGMVKGFEYKNLLSIGFLNFNFDELRDIYKENFDVVLEGDGDFNFINNLMEDLN